MNSTLYDHRHLSPHLLRKARAVWSDREPRNAKMSAAAGGDISSPAKRVAVVGAGVSGLAAAYKLKSIGVNVTVYEAEGKIGGKLRSVSQGGLIWDEGANTVTESDVEVR